MTEPSVCLVMNYSAVNAAPEEMRRGGRERGRERTDVRTVRGKVGGWCVYHRITHVH